MPIFITFFQPQHFEIIYNYIYNFCISICSYFLSLWIFGAFLLKTLKFCYKNPYHAFLTLFYDINLIFVYIYYFYNIIIKNLLFL